MSYRRRVGLLAAILTLTASATAVTADAGKLELLSSEGFADVIEEHNGSTVIVNLWATWCVPCLKEIPDLIRLEQELADQGVVLVAVSMDDPYDFARVDAFRLKHFPDFSSYLRDTPDMDSMISVIDPVWNELLPTTYLLDSEGAVIKRIQGKKSYDDFHAIVTAILE